MTNTVTLLTISYRMIPIVTCAFCRKANADSRFVRPSAILKREDKNVKSNLKYLSKFSRILRAHLVLADHGHLLHRMQNVAKHLIRMVSMDLVRAFDTKVKRRRRFNGIRDGNVMVVTDFCSFRITGIRTAIPLTYKRGEII